MFKDCTEEEDIDVSSNENKKSGDKSFKIYVKQDNKWSRIVIG